MALDTLRRRIARWIAPASRPAQPAAARLYNGAQPSRLMFNFGSGTTSGDGELSSSLAVLRNRSRQLMRDNAYAKRAKSIIRNNVIGSGVGLQAQVMTTRGELATSVNDSIESAWRDWCHADACHTGGTLHFHDLERVACSQLVEAGEIILRKHNRRFGSSQIPFALEVIEPERIADQFTAPPPGQSGQVRLGIEVDEFQRPVAYYIRRNHPGDGRWTTMTPDAVERVPARDIFHLFIADRFPQSRGVPWLHTTIRTINDVGATTEAEISAARAAACYMGFIESADAADPPGTGDTAATGQSTLPFEPGMWERLAYGEKATFVAPNRPNAALPDFLRYMLRELAAGIEVSYESLSRDYSQSNYSSSRLALLDDRDLWRVLQQWWVRAFREPLHREWLQAAVLARAVAIPVDAYGADPARYLAVKWKLRGWSWVDPTKEVEAYKSAVRAGFTTITDVIAQTAMGQDLEDVIATRSRELQMLDEADIDVDTDPGEFDAAGKAQAEAPEPVDPIDPAEQPEDRSVHVNVSPSIHVPERAINIAGARIEVPPPQVHMKSPSVTVEAPVINVAPPDVRIEPAVVNIAPAEVVVNPPVVNVAAPAVRVETPAPVVNVAPVEVRVEPTPVNVEAPRVTVVNEQADTVQDIERDERQEIKRVVTRKVRSQ